MGVKPDELTDVERRAIREQINGQLPYLDGFATAIVGGSQANGGLLTPLLQRGELWAMRYDQVREAGRASAGADRKAVWTLGNTEHCGSCLKLAGKVKRYSQWTAAGILPKVGALECGGWQCGCSLPPTDQPLSKGPLPSLP